MKFVFSWRITLIGIFLIFGMLRLSYWQWQRHVSKTEYIKSMEKRLAEPVTPIEDLLSQNLSAEDLEYRRVSVSGIYDYKNEVILRNRKFNDDPGVFVLTPLKIEKSDKHLVVSRGFIPLAFSEKDKRLRFQFKKHDNFVGLIKKGAKPRFLAPKDPPSGYNLPWVDAWLRVDIEEMAKQLPYAVLPFYVEIMNTVDEKVAKSQIIVSDSNRNDIFLLTNRDISTPPKEGDDLSIYPVPVFDTVVPPGRHFGYVFEWAIMALATLIICVILQMRRPRLPMTLII